MGEYVVGRAVDVQGQYETIKKFIKYLLIARGFTAKPLDHPTQPITLPPSLQTLFNVLEECKSHHIRIHTLSLRIGRSITHAVEGYTLTFEKDGLSIMDIISQLAEEATYSSLPLLKPLPIHVLLYTDPNPIPIPIPPLKRVSHPTHPIQGYHYLFLGDDHPTLQGYMYQYTLTKV